MYILGISAYYHDSAAAIIRDGKIIAAAQEERFTRKKHDPGFPHKAARFCLQQAGIGLADIEAVVFYDKPFLKFERLLETFYNFAPKGFLSFLKAMPVWIKEKLFLKKILIDELSTIDKAAGQKVKLLFSEHHLSHSASAFFPSPFQEAAILTIDGVGEWATASISHGQENQIKVLRELHFPHSVGLLYSAFTYYLGFRVNSGEYKLMGLAPYGNPESAQTKEYIRIIKEKLIDLKEDGSVGLNQEYFDYATGLKMTHNSKWQALFGFKRREGESELEQAHCDLALAIQTVTEEIVLKLAQTAKDLTGSKNICLAGGVALNCVANGKILQSGIFENIWLQPAAGDAGGALGAALATYHIYFQKTRVPGPALDEMSGAYLGPSFTEAEIQELMGKYSAKSQHFDNFSSLSKKVAQDITLRKVVGWVQGRSEWGPRSLGNRSILGDARNPEMQKKLNVKIKYRESFRPFAPSVLAEDCAEYFDLKGDSPYMLLVAPVSAKRRKPLPINYHDLSLREKLYHLRSDLPAITHLDYSARVQTVHKETNERYWQLINEFKKQTGLGVIVNTSFNVRGEPIVCTPEDSYRCFMRTEMDVLVIGNHVFYKGDQPTWTETDNWKEEFVLD